MMFFATEDEVIRGSAAVANLDRRASDEERFKVAKREVWGAEPLCAQTTRRFRKPEFVCCTFGVKDSNPDCQWH